MASRTALPPATTVQIRFPAWHDGQKRILAERKRFNVAALGRRSGKTALSQYLLAIPALKHRQPVAYFAPQYKLLAETWREIEARMAHVIRKSSLTERRMDLVTGGVLDFWTLEDPDAGRSRRYARAVIDEAGLVPHLGDTWERAIRPTLADLVGDAYFLGTPKGRNFFYRAHQRGIDPLMADWASWQMPTSVNPHIDPAEIEAMREGMTERSYRQEILAEFLDDAGGVFRFVRELAAARQLDAGIPGRSYVAGLDWGREHDFTVLAVLDTTSGDFVHVMRFTALPYAIQRQRIKAVVSCFGNCPVLAEENSIGAPNIEQLQADGVRVTPFFTSGGSHGTKGALIDAYTLGFEEKKIHLPAGDEVMIGEHEAYECERLPSGGFRYSAPEGIHDDTVIAGALAWYHANAKPLVRIGVQR